MRSHHDVGGLPGSALDQTGHIHQPWEKRVDAMLVLMVEKGIITLDEHRRVHESTSEKAYFNLGYYERWIAAMANLLVMKGTISIAEIANKMQDVEERVKAGDDRAI